MVYLKCAESLNPKILITRKTIFNYTNRCILTKHSCNNFITYLLSHYAVYLNSIKCYMSIISQQNWKELMLFHFSLIFSMHYSKLHGG